MTEAPERITAWVNNDGSTQFAGDKLFPKEIEVEYIRADTNRHATNTTTVEPMDTRWTEVGSALPNKGQQVIAWAKDGDSQVKNLMQETHFNGRDFVYGFHSNWMRGVTHWMPFPEPPETEE